MVLMTIVVLNDADDDCGVNDLMMILMY